MDKELLREATAARDRALDLQSDAEQAQVAYQHAIRRLYASGASLREVADAVGLSYQRVHQIVDPGSGKAAMKLRPDDGIESSGRQARRVAREDPACSFCGRPPKQVKRLIAGPGVFVCDRCIALAREVLTTGEERRGRDVLLVVETDPEATCSFCGKRQDEVDGMVAASAKRPGGKFAPRRHEDARECSDCLALCGEIISETLSPMELRRRVAERGGLRHGL